MAETIMPAGMPSGAGKTADVAWIRALYEFGHSAASGTDPLRVRQDILNHIVEGFDAESGSIALIVDGTEDQLEIAAGTDLPPGVLGSRLQRGVGVYGHVIATGQPLLINGNAAEAGLPLRMTEPRDRPAHSAMCWPLIVQEQIIGALAINRATSRAKYTVEDLDRGQSLTSLLALVIANHRMNIERDNRIVELSTLNATMQRVNVLLEDAQDQLIQSEKLASIGQMAAGVAHEINNPIGFVSSNLGTLESYLQSVFGLLAAYIEADKKASAPISEALAHARTLRKGHDFDFLRGDVTALLAESRDGLVRVKRIVQDMKDFSRSGTEDAWEMADLHSVLDTTLNIVRSEVKQKARIEIHYGDLPKVECLPSNLSQVFMNLLCNAAQSIDADGTITLSTGVDGGEVWVRVEDTGSGISEEHLNRIFDPFFTTKPVGQGTGLGLSVSYSIVRKHGGQIDVTSEVGRGTQFTVRLPIHHTPAEALQIMAAGTGAELMAHAAPSLNRATH
jgi:two-component system NtrC family sensor kinase